MKHYRIRLIALAAIIVLTLGTSTACGGSDNSKKEIADNTKSSNSSKSESESSLIKDISENKTEETDKQESKKDPTDEKEKSEIPEISQNEDGAQDIGGLIIYNKQAYEKFYGYDELAKNYGNTMDRIHDALGNDVKIYNVLVPTHCGISLPKEISDEYGLQDQNEFINTVLKAYSDEKENPIVGINTYDILMHHRDEPIYLNTDHHWSGLGAYYAYKEFCKSAGVDYIQLSDLTKGEIRDYYGSLTAYVDSSYLEPDTVEYYKTDKDISTTAYENDGSGGTSTVLIHDYMDSSFAYGVFLGGDRGLMVSKNKDGNGKKIAVVKESYGNAFCPYIAYTYSETHMIDFRYFDLDFRQYLKDNDIHEVIFINNTMASATEDRCDELNNLVG